MKSFKSVWIYVRTIGRRYKNPLGGHSEDRYYIEALFQKFQQLNQNGFHESYMERSLVSDTNVEGTILQSIAVDYFQILATTVALKKQFATFSIENISVMAGKPTGVLGLWLHV